MIKGGIMSDNPMGYKTTPQRLSRNIELLQTLSEYYTDSNFSANEQQFKAIEETLKITLAEIDDLLNLGEK